MPPARILGEITQGLVEITHPFHLRAGPDARKPVVRTFHQAWHWHTACYRPGQRPYSKGVRVVHELPGVSWLAAAPQDKCTER